jgi:hypothetical protein
MLKRLEIVLCSKEDFLNVLKQIIKKKKKAPVETDAFDMCRKNIIFFPFRCFAALQPLSRFHSRTRNLHLTDNSVVCA